MKLLINRYSIFAIALTTTSITVLLLLLRSITIVPAGYVGVVDSFGSVSSQTLKPGLSFKNPLSQVVKFSTRTQEMKETLDAPSKEGLNIKLDVSILYHVDEKKAQEIYQTIGTDYEQIILIPQFRSVIRKVTATYNAKALYTSERQKLAQEIRDSLSQLVANRGIIIEDTPLRKLELPAKISQAVEDKLQAEQQTQQMDFVIQKERKEAERKRIEARGIADSQQIISQGLNDKLLQLKQIEANEKLAQSSNAKIVVVGTSRQGEPLIIQP
ncbi:prohibitin family protein [Synechocystis sp. PCC 7509]|uniref:prohibitin family protein n=1 Tax=Synechocystis sp. PCC 7509 TaxID=927677 RepID=UPI0002AC0788|nr:prohibitin family protein [Synechocystis sp. PCC 7509]